MPVTKSELIDQLSAEARLPRATAEEIVNIIFDSMVNTLQRGERIEIRGFGSFEVREYRAYEGRNPRTGDPVKVDSKRLPFFKVGKELRERVNRGAGNGAAAEDDDDDDSPSMSSDQPDSPVAIS